MCVTVGDMVLNIWLLLSFSPLLLTHAPPPPLRRLRSAGGPTEAGADHLHHGAAGQHGEGLHHAAVHGGQAALPSRQDAQSAREPGERPVSAGELERRR